jgi:hypothetical protein
MDGQQHAAQLHRLVTRPLDVVTEITRGQSHQQAHETVSAYFGKLLDEGALSQVPHLTPDNVEKICDKRLVRYRAMVSRAPGFPPHGAASSAAPPLGAGTPARRSPAPRQPRRARPRPEAVAPAPTGTQVIDMLDPEYHIASFTRPDGSTGITLYDDTPPVDLEQATQTNIWERRPLYCTPVPAESAWARAKWAGQPVEPSTPGRSPLTRWRGLLWAAPTQHRHPPCQGLHPPGTAIVKACMRARAMTASPWCGRRSS